MAKPPPRMITRVLEGRLACSATTLWTVAGQGVSMQDDQGDDIASGSRTALRSGVPSFETLSAVPSSRDATF